MNFWGWNVDYCFFDDVENNNFNFYFELCDIECMVVDVIDDGVVMVFVVGNGYKMFFVLMLGVIVVGGVMVDVDGFLKVLSYVSFFDS